MLNQLTIENIVLIERLSLSCAGGFTTLTGETGAGKSILLDSLGLALGARSEARLVRGGADRASVTAVFDVPKHQSFQEIFISQEMDVPEELIIRRVLSKDGKSKAFLNDQPVSIGLLKQIGDQLVEIHGQFETQGLLDPKSHGRILDSYGSLATNVLDVQNAWENWKDLEKRLIAVKQKISQTEEDEEYLRSSLQALEDLNPQKGEVEALTEKRNILMATEQIMQALQTAVQSISGDKGAEEKIYQACKGFERLPHEAAQKTDDFIQRMDRALSELRDCVGDMESLGYELSQSEENVENVDDRLHALKGEARKHNCFPDELPEMLEKLQSELEALDNLDSEKERLENEVIQARQDYIKVADILSVAREQAAKIFEQTVNAELPPLKLEKAKIFVQLERMEEERWGINGVDQVRFQISTNPGQAPGPLNKIASGGELSRFMLAFKVVMAETDACGTMIFDEIDAGVGGSTAAAIGDRLYRLAQNKQILVVTHSPQVAARADQHWVISKQVTADDKMRTNVNVLDIERRREEIARMLAGSEITTEARAAAEKLLERGAA